MLAASHAVGVNAYIDEEVATFLTDFLLEHYPALLTARYGFSTEGMDGVAVIAAVAKKRGCLLKGGGGELDLEKAATILINDYRSGSAGPDQYGNADPCAKRVPGSWPRLLAVNPKNNENSDERE
jgi:ribosome biogenesis GTPase A